MSDNLNENGREPFDLQYYLGLVRRRHLHFLIPLFISWAVVWGASWGLPPRYRSSTLILVEQPAMPKDYVTPNVSNDLQERLQSITQQILSRTRLLHIIDKFNLYSTPHAQQSLDDKVERMRKDIKIELVRDSRDQINAFNVYYSAYEPTLAQQVTGELTNLFINENIEVRQRQSEDTTKFLERQLQTARNALADQEEKIRRFQMQHVGEMPAQLQMNLQILGGLQSQLQGEEDALNAAKQQHVYLQSLLDQYRALQSTGRSPEGAAAGLPAIDLELERLRTQLTDLSSRYTDRHPEVRKLKERIAKNEKMRDQLLASLKSTTSENTTEVGDSNRSADIGADPTQTSMLLQVQSQMRSNQVEITNREHSIARLRTKVEEYQSRLNQEPVREQHLADLTRGYEQSKATYDDLLKKKNESAMATSMEMLQRGERFRIMDPPSLPQKPEFPNHLKFCGIGLCLGLALGVFVAGGFEMADDRLHSEKELKKLLPGDVIVEIPTIADLANQRQTRRRQWLGWCTGVFVFGTILAGAAFSYLRG